MKSKPDIIQFVKDERLLGLSISAAQETLLRGIYGLPLLSDEQRDIWQLCTEREYTGQPFGEVMVISGARGGKDSRIAAPIVLYESLFGGHEKRVAKGEVGTIVLVAQDARAVGVAFGYIRDYLLQSPVLSPLLDGEPLTNSLRLTNGLVVQCFPCTLKSMRGFSIPVAVMDEVAYFRLEGQADSDVEIQTSIRRGMVGFTSGTKLIKISTPYMRGGVLYDDFQRAFGKPDPDLLVWRATSRLMNPVTFSHERLTREERLDPVRFRREYLAEFVDDVAAFLPQHLIDAAVKPERHELPYRDGLPYTMAVDPSGGGPDHFTCSVVHAEGKGADLRVVQDLLKGWATRGGDTVDLEGIVAEIVDIAKRYHVKNVYGDKYSRDWVGQAFKRHGIRYDSDHHPPLDKSAAYLETEPLFTQGRIEILDHDRQRRELVCLERRPRPGNKASVDHPTSAGAHDDYSNALALAAAIASRKRGVPVMLWGLTEKQEEAARKAEDDKARRGLDGFHVHWMPCANCGESRGYSTELERAALERGECIRCKPGWKWTDVIHGRMAR